MERAVVHAVLAVEVVLVRLDIRRDGREVAVADAEEHGGGLYPLALGVAKLGGDACTEGDVGVASRVDHDLRAHVAETGLREEPRAGYARAVHQRLDEVRVEEHLHASLGAHLVQEELQRLRLCRRGSPSDGSRRRAPRAARRSR